MSLLERIASLRKFERAVPTNTTLTIRVQKHLHAKVQMLAMQNGSSASEIGRLLLHEGLNSVGVDPRNIV